MQLNFNANYIQTEDLYYVVIEHLETDRSLVNLLRLCTIHRLLLKGLGVGFSERVRPIKPEP